MAKSNTIQVKMVSSADTGYFYVKNRNPKTKTEKLELKKYDPKIRKHVIFKEQKIKSRANKERIFVEDQHILGLCSEELLMAKQLMMH